MPYTHYVLVAFHNDLVYYLVKIVAFVYLHLVQTSSELSCNRQKQVGEVGVLLLQHSLNTAFGLVFPRSGGVDDTLVQLSRVFGQWQ